MRYNNVSNACFWSESQSIDFDDCDQKNKNDIKMNNNSWFKTKMINCNSRIGNQFANRVDLQRNNLLFLLSGILQ